MALFLRICVFLYDRLKEREERGLVCPKSAREKIYTTRENSKIFDRENDFLPVQKTNNLHVKTKYWREKS